METGEERTTCARCPGTSCYPLIPTGAPDFCPMLHLPEVMEKVAEEYSNPSVREFARLASIQEVQCYEVSSAGIRTKIPRIEETMEFAKKC